MFLNAAIKKFAPKVLWPTRHCANNGAAAFGWDPDLLHQQEAISSNPSIAGSQEPVHLVQ